MQLLMAVASMEFSTVPNTQLFSVGNVINAFKTSALPGQLPDTHWVFAFELTENDRSTPWNYAYRVKNPSGAVAPSVRGSASGRTPPAERPGIQLIHNLGSFPVTSMGDTKCSSF